MHDEVGVADLKAVRDVVRDAQFLEDRIRGGDTLNAAKDPIADRAIVQADAVVRAGDSDAEGRSESAGDNAVATEIQRNVIGRNLDAAFGTAAVDVTSQV